MNDDELMRQIRSGFQAEGLPPRVSRWKTSDAPAPVSSFWARLRSRPYVAASGLALTASAAALAAVLTVSVVHGHTNTPSNHRPVNATASAPQTSAVATANPTASPTASISPAVGKPNPTPGLAQAAAPASAAGGTHVSAWGGNDSGTSGNGTYNQSDVPVAMNLPESTHVTQMAESGSNSVILFSDGSVWVAGRGQEGELGNGTYPASSATLVKSSIKGVVAVATGQYAVYALKGDGTVWSWGWNRYGELGDNSTNETANPVEVVGLSNVVRIASGRNDAVALKSDGTVWAWGDNSAGELGNGTQCSPNSGCEGSGTPVQVHGPGNSGDLTGVVAIASGDFHNLALRSDGTVWGWGADNYGQLGDHSYGNESSPVQMLAPGGAQGLHGITSVSAGSEFSLMLQSNGTVLGAGFDDQGEIGNNSAGTNQTIPVAVAGLTNVAQISAGFDHSLALRSDGSVWAWGNNDSGQLGIGTAGGQQNSPVRVVSLSGIISVVAGGGCSLALS